MSVHAKKEERRTDAFGRGFRLKSEGLLRVRLAKRKKKTCHAKKELDTLRGRGIRVGNGISSNGPWKLRDKGKMITEKNGGEEKSGYGKKNKTGKRGDQRRKGKGAN